MGKLITKIKSSKIVNKGIIKKVKDKIYFKYISPKEEKKTDKHREIIFEKFNNVFKDSKYALMCGSLLRYHRDNTMDGQDLDFFTFREDFEKVCDRFINEGFVIKQVFLDEKGTIYEYKLGYKDCDVDVFLIYTKKKQEYFRFTMENNDSKDISKKVVGDIQIISGTDLVGYERAISGMTEIKNYEYKNTTFMGPKNVETSLYELYGENWTIYDPSYDPRYAPKTNLPKSYNDAKSIVFIKPLTKIEDVKKIIKELK